MSPYDLGCLDAFHGRNSGNPYWTLVEWEEYWMGYEYTNRKMFEYFDI